MRISEMMNHECHELTRMFFDRIDRIICGQVADSSFKIPLILSKEMWNVKI